MAYDSLCDGLEYARIAFAKLAASAPDREVMTFATLTFKAKFFRKWNETPQRKAMWLNLLKDQALFALDMLIRCGEELGLTATDQRLCLDLLTGAGLNREPEAVAMLLPHLDKPQQEAFLAGVI